jgi:hypothetical protein
MGLLALSIDCPACEKIEPLPDNMDSLGLDRAFSFYSLTFLIQSLIALLSIAIHQTGLATLLRFLKGLAGVSDSRGMSAVSLKYLCSEQVYLRQILSSVFDIYCSN